MANDQPTYRLIARSVPADTPQLAQMRTALARTYRLDPFILQQRLIGRGPNLIAEGTQDRLHAIAALLAEQNIDCRVIEARPPRFVPLRLRRVQIGAERLDLVTDERTVSLEPHHRVMAVLADLSGRAAAKNLRHLVAQRNYKGIAAPRPVDDATLTKAILQGEPVLDLYRLDEQGRIEAGVRVLPGRFDPRGMGEHASLSAAGNLRALLEQTRRRTGECRLILDFGLANLPGCRLKSSQETSRWRDDNLAALTCFGWQMAAFISPATPRAATTTPLLAAAEILAADDAPRADTAAPAPAPAAPELPPPPAGEGRQTAAGARMAAVFIAAVGFGLASATYPRVLTDAFRLGTRTGVLPAALTGACLWGAFYFLRLKHHIQNTPTSKVRSMALGLVELQGRAVRKYALIAPVSKLSCVFYRLRKYRRDSKNNWRLVQSSDSGHVPFYLEDETGRVVVDPGGAAVTARCKQESYGEGGGLFGSFGGSHHEKWVEEFVPEGTSLYILGQAREHRRQQRSSLRERVACALRELKRDPQAVQRFDTDGDGRISATEWEQARTHVERQVLEQSLTEAATPAQNGERIVVGRPRQRSLPFVIAETLSEAHLLRKYTLLAVPLFAGALAGLIWTLVTVNAYLQP